MIAAFLSVVILMKSGSATALVSAVCGLATMVFVTVVQRSPLRLRPLTLIIACVLISLLLMIFSLAPDLLFNKFGRDSTFTSGTQIWAAVWSWIVEHPIRGYGWAFWVKADNSVKLAIWREVGDTVAHSHNTWLDIWLQLGLPRLLIAVTTIIFLITRAGYLLLTSQRPDIHTCISVFWSSCSLGLSRKWNSPIQPLAACFIFGGVRR